MTTKRNFLVIVIVWLCLLWAIGSGTYFACYVAPDQAFALTDTPLGEQQNIQIRRISDRNGPDRRLTSRPIPPKAAFDACEGKKEGEPCRFSSQNEILNGECRTNFENEFACRPDRGAPPSQSVQGATPLPGVEPRSLSQPESGTYSMANRDTDGRPQYPSILPLLATGLYSRIGRYVGELGIYIVIAMISAGLTWYFFFRQLTLPLRRLRKVTQQLAGGYLSARVGEGLVHRKNEVIDLGRDVDRMAERIESLVGAHQRLIRD